MGTLQAKLEKLIATKADLKAALIERGQPVSDEDTFASYADKVRAIQSGEDVTRAVPVITVDSGGLVTATTTQETGFVTGGTEQATYQLPVMEAASVTPGASEQTVHTAEHYLLGDIVILGDVDLVPDNILEGVTIFGVTGTATTGGFEATTSSVTLTNKSGGAVVVGYHPQPSAASWTTLSLANKGSATVTCYIGAGIYAQDAQGELLTFTNRSGVALVGNTGSSLICVTAASGSAVIDIV